MRAAMTPGWYPDPSRQGSHRWWDGRQWTASVRANLAPPGATAPSGPHGQSRHTGKFGSRAVVIFLAAAFVVVAAAIIILALVIAPEESRLTSNNSGDSAGWGLTEDDIESALSPAGEEWRLVDECVRDSCPAAEGDHSVTPEECALIWEDGLGTLSYQGFEPVTITAGQPVGIYVSILRPPTGGTSGFFEMCEHQRKTAMTSNTPYRLLRVKRLCYLKPTSGRERHDSRCTDRW